MAKRKVTNDESEQSEPEQRSAKRVRREGPSPEREHDGAGRRGTGTQKGPGREAEDKLASSTSDTARDAEGSKVQQPSVHHQSGRGVTRKRTAASAYDKDERRRNRRADAAPEPTSVAAADAAPAAVAGGDGPPESGAGDSGASRPDWPRPNTQQGASQTKSSPSPKRPRKRLAAGDDGEADTGATAHSHQRGKRAKTRDDNSERQSLRPRRKAAISASAKSREPGAGAGARDRQKPRATPAPGSQLPPLALPHGPTAVHPSEPGPAAAPAEAQSAAKTSPPAEASPPATAPAPRPLESPLFVPESKSPRSRHPPLARPAARSPIPADSSGGTQDFGWEELIQAAGAFSALQQLVSQPFVLMAELNAAQDRLPLFLTEAGMKAGGARAKRFCRDVVSTQNQCLGPLSLRDFAGALKGARVRLDGLWETSRRAVRESVWEEDPVTHERYAVV